jgi:outer membrane lipoprotein SlyB
LKALIVRVAAVLALALGGCATDYSYRPPTYSQKTEKWTVLRAVDIYRSL